MLKKILNKKEAMEYLNIGRARLDAEIKSGHIRFKIIGKRLMFPLWTLDEWLNDTTKHIDCTNVEKHGTRIYHTSELTDHVPSLDALVAQQKEQKLNNSLLKKSIKLKRNLSLQTANI